MKLAFLLSVALLATFTVHSQVAWNIFAGPQLTSTHYTIEGTRQDNDLKIGFQAGLGAKVAFENQLSFTPSAFYSLKGYKVNYNRSSWPPDSEAVNNSTSIHTFEIAGMLQFDFSSRPSHAFIRLGPSLDFQLFGHEKFKLSSGSTVSRAMKYSFGEYGHFSANLLVHVGFEAANGLIFYAQYTRGVTSINNADEGPKILHRAYGITIGKFLHRQKIVLDTKNKE